MIGSVLEDRYEIIEQLGSGGMSVIYKAFDRKLNRTVAIKVLRQEFLTDEDFLRRFRREAESVQRLHHPNLVETYDVQVSEPPYYIVMELVEGDSLDKVLARAPFTYEQVVYYVAQMARALAHAHNNQVIHRDIKPHNMMIDQNEHLKLTDFGIALNVSTSTLSNTRAIIGSVHYFSPEQAQGKPVTEQSDLYSLGIVFYEMLARRVPFVGDTPIELALKHIQEDVPPLQDFCPDLPSEIENIVMKLLEKNPEDRYASAEDLLVDLESLLSAGIQPDADRVNKPRTLTPTERAEIKRKKLMWRRRGVITFVSLILLLLLGYPISKSLFKSNKDFVLVPNVTEMSLSDAVSLLDTSRLNYQILESIYDKKHGEGVVLRQSPIANTKVKIDRVISLTISKGLELRQVPMVVGATERAAVVQLENEAFTVKIKTELSTTTPEGTVIRQEPESLKHLPIGSEIVITVSAGVEKVRVPDIRGLSVIEARKVLESIGLALGDVETVIDSEQPKLVIVEQQPSAETVVAKGSFIHVVENQGVAPATITINFDEVEESLIKVVVSDNDANNPTRVIYEKKHLKGEPPLILEIPFVSPTLIEVYRNGELEFSKKY